MGPTAAGKTDLAIALCKKLPCEIISVDSALVYRGLDIGSAKPSAQILKEFPHRLVNIRDPAMPYSAANFREDALQAMAEISAQGRIPLLVGGTMLYFKILLHGMSDLPAADALVRQRIDQDAAAHGWPFIHRQLAEVDPQSAQRIHPNDPQRLQRALEVFRMTGVSMTQWRERELRQGSKDLQAACGHALPYRIIQLALSPLDRSTLHERIAGRFELMMKEGLLEEVRKLYERGDLNAQLPAIRAVGYRQVWDYLEGKLSYEEMLERAIIATRQLAKRQYTWLRSWKDLNWIFTDRLSGSGAALAAGEKEAGKEDKKIAELVGEALNYIMDNPT